MSSPSRKKKKSITKKIKKIGPSRNRTERSRLPLNWTSVVDV